MKEELGREALRLRLSRVTCWFQGFPLPHPKQDPRGSTPPPLRQHSLQPPEGSLCLRKATEGPGMSLGRWQGLNGQNEPVRAPGLRGAVSWSGKGIITPIWPGHCGVTGDPVCRAVGL